MQQLQSDVRIRDDDDDAVLSSRRFSKAIASLGVLP
jgi:hypothetical protein